MKNMKWSMLLDDRRVREVKRDKGSDQPKDQSRGQFCRDRGRAIFSTPLRRLQDKAQVFPLEPNDSVRTRLTHSLEVASVARDLAKEVSASIFHLKVPKQRQYARKVESIAETCALLHDIGNPPFGHAGEDAIQEWFMGKAVKDNDQLTNLGSVLAFDGDGDRKGTASDAEGAQLFQDFAKYEGNAQTLRTMARLQLMADPDGLNLTLGTLAALQKYIASSDQLHDNRQSFDKPGHFASEKDLVELVRKETGTGERRHPIAFLVEAADDAVYCAIDLEDGLNKGVLSWTDIKNCVRDEYDKGEELVKSVENNIDNREEEAYPEDSLTAREKEEAYCALFRTYVIGALKSSAAKVFCERYEDIMSGVFDSELLAEGEEAQLWRCCKTLAINEVFKSRRILELESMGNKVINDLLDFFWEGARHFDSRVGEVPKEFPFARKAFNLMSENYRRVFRDDLSGGQLPEEYYQLQLVTDYVAGMTDSFAQRVHRKLSNARI